MTCCSSDDGNDQPMFEIILLPCALQQISDEGNRKHDSLSEVDRMRDESIWVITPWQRHKREKENSGHCPQSHEAVNGGFFDPGPCCLTRSRFPHHQTHTKNERQIHFGNSSAPDRESG